MKKDAEHISVNKSCFPTTQINGFTYIMSEASVPFPVIQLFRKFTKVPVKESLC